MAYSPDIEKIRTDLENEMERLVRESDVNSRETKILLEKLFGKLSEYNSEKIQRLHEEAENQIFSREYNTKFRRIYTALADNKILDMIGNFFPVADPSLKFDIDRGEVKQKDFIGVFFSCSYDEFIKYTDSGTYDRYYDISVDGRDTKCSFRVNYSFTAAEKFLAMAAEQYGFDFPLIYSPFSRRFAELIIHDDDIDKSKIKSIDYKSLSEVIEADTLTHTLVWNVKITERTVPPLKDNADLPQDSLVSCERIIPSKEYVFKSIYKCQENEYIIFDGIDADNTAVTRRKGKNEIYVVYDAQQKINPVRKLLISEPDETELSKFGMSFVNYFSPCIFNKIRVNTCADILYVTGCFNNNPFGVSVSEDITVLRDNIPENTISAYNQPHRYYKYLPFGNYTQNKHRGIPESRGVCCVLKFSGYSIFAEDYARYVLEYLNEKYPEFYWVGEWSRK
ncbi:MAG: hypothetical protein IJ666_07515 [Ruminococcus sp.]|nr:hypothetical protein [Ruminococcus sp.]